MQVVGGRYITMSYRRRYAYKNREMIIPPKHNTQKVHSIQDEACYRQYLSEEGHIEKYGCC